MAEAHPILCSKCKKPGTADKSECASCHGRVVRMCGACGFTNSAAKKYCDACGENFSLAKAAPPPPPKPEAKAPEAPKAAPKPPPPAPRPEPKPEPRPEPKPPAKPPVQIKLEDIKLPDAAPSADAPLELRPRLDTPAPRPITPADKERAALPPEKKPEPEKPKDLPPPERPPGKSAKDEAMERYLPKTIISRIPKKSDKDPVKRDDEPVPDMKRPEKPAPPPEKPAPPKREDKPDPLPGPERKKERVHMRLEGETPPPKPVEPPKEPAKPAAKADAKDDKPPAKPAEPRKPGELDPRLAKGFDRPPEKPADRPEKDKHHGAPPPKKVEGPSQTFIQRRPKAVASTVLALVLLATGFAAFFVKSRQKANPGDTLLKAAGDYLVALKAKEFDKAYGMLSADTKRSVAPGAFRALQDESSWSLDDLGGEIVAPGWAVVRYKLFVPSQPVESDWLVMRFEDGRWTRAYWWPLMEAIEGSLARGDHAGAARLAKDAVAIDPLDPMPSAYYCEAAWMAGDAATALESCEKALKQSETLPSRIGNDGIFRARHIIADVYRNTLKKTAEAAELYGQLLKYPRIEPAQACDLGLAKAEAELELGRQDASLEAFRAAQGACRAEADAAFAAQGVSVLAGEAGPEAVAAVQAHRMPGDDSTLVEWRAKSRAEMSKRMKTRLADLPAETWVPAHKAGPVYTVTLKAGDSVVLSAEVDLFSRKVKVDMNVQ